MLGTEPCGAGGGEALPPRGSSSSRHSAGLLEDSQGLEVRGVKTVVVDHPAPTPPDWKSVCLRCAREVHLELKGIILAALPPRSEGEQALSCTNGKVRLGGSQLVKSQ